MSLQVRNYKQDVVYLCQPCLENSNKSASPFCNKVETWLKFAGIAYEIQHTFQKGPNGKWPYVELNGETIADSSVIIERLGEHFQTDLDADLTPEQVAVSRSFQLLIEDHLFWRLVYYSWYDRQIFRNQFLPLLFYSIPSFIRSFVGVYIIQPLVRWKLRIQGIGKLPVEQIQDGVEKDLQAISNFLQNKQYFMGEKKSIIDTTVFGFLGAMLRTGLDTPAVRSLKKYDNLVEYVTRIENNFKAEGKKTK